MIPKEKYAEIMEVLPILCVDIIIKNLHDEYLLIKRANEPLKGEWWVIGGRVLKGETLRQAAIRKIKEEVGLTASNLELVGYYEDIYENNPFGMPTPQHSVSIVFSTTVDGCEPVQLDCQSSDWKFSKDLPERFCVTLVRGAEQVT